MAYCNKNDVLLVITALLLCLGALYSIGQDVKMDSALQRASEYRYCHILGGDGNTFCNHK